MAIYRTVGVMAKHNDPAASRTLLEVVRLIAARADAPASILVPPGGPTELDAVRPLERLELPEMARRCDLMIVVGGDGTFLSVARSVAPRGIPVLGINHGRLGFLVEVSPQDMAEALERTFDGRAQIEERHYMHARILRADGRREGKHAAINDVVIRNQASVRMIEFETWLEEEFISQHRADGIIVCTPTGSTAYALSGGGPIVHPGVKALSIVPICPHTLSDRPIVVPADRKIRIVLRAAATATLDGQISDEVGPGDTVEIGHGRHLLRIVHPTAYSYFGLLRDKFWWGRGPSAAPARA